MRLFAKFAVIAVALGAMALGLLALRQQRYEVSNEIARAHNRIVDQERAIWRLRADVASRSSPADIRAAAGRIGVRLAPIQESASPEPPLAAKSDARSVAGPVDPRGAAARKGTIRARR